MTTKPAIQAIAELSARVSQLEGENYKFWLPVVISVLAVGVSIYATGVSRRTADKQLQLNIESARQVTLQQIKSNIGNAKAQVESMSMQIAPLKALSKPTAQERRELEMKTQAFDSAVERLLNAYDDGCMVFYKEQVVRQDFIDLFHQDIADYVRAFSDKFTPPLTRFNWMVRYYEDRHKSARA